MYCDRLWHNARLATLTPNRQGLGVVEDGIVACRGGAIVYAGPRASAAEEFEPHETVDCARRWITPGLIDCHTHLIYGGNRSAEFEQRHAGVSYEKIAQAGGGIASTVAATRAADDAVLLRDAGRRLDAMMADGATTVEIKSGYGLTLEHERKQLRLARQLAAARSIEITTTFLGLHACPAEFKDLSDEYVDLVCQTMLPALASEGLIDAVDAFCETVGFTPAQVRKFFKAAARYRLPVKLHAEQLSNQHGAILAAEFSALSADHLEHLDDAGADAMAAAKVIAVLLPGAFYCLKETKVPPVDLLRARQIPMAIATDCNPGSSPMTSLLLAMNMAATLFGLTTEECIAGVTRNAARALGRHDRIGTLDVGQFCDLAIWDVNDLSELVHGMGFNPLHTRVWRGK